MLGHPPRMHHERSCGASAEGSRAQPGLAARPGGDGRQQCAALLPTRCRRLLPTRCLLWLLLLLKLPAPPAAAAPYCCSLLLLLLPLLLPPPACSQV